MQSFKSSTSTIRPICIKLVRVLYHLFARKRSFCWQIRDKQNWSITLNYSIQSFFPFRYLLHSFTFLLWTTNKSNTQCNIFSVYILVPTPKNKKWQLFILKRYNIYMYVCILCTSGNAKMQQVPLFHPAISCQLTIGLIFLSFLQVVVFILFILLTF